MPLRKLAVHASCWTLFIAYEVGISSYFGDHSTIFEFALFYLLDILLFYTNADFVFYNLVPARNFSRFTCLMAALIGELSLYSYCSLVLNNSFKHLVGTVKFTQLNFPVIIMAVWRGVYFLGLSIAYWAVTKTIRSGKIAQKAAIQELNSLREMQRLENDLIRLQNAYLQANINPHFLFNTLNFVYYQVEEGNPDASKNILLLSEIMHYSLENLEKDGKVPLSREIEHIKRYIELNKFRFDNKVYLKDTIGDLSTNETRVPPLLILTFVENVFKHGDLTDESHPGIIQIDYKDHALLLYTNNKKNKSLHLHRQGSGIENARTRLKNYYGDLANLKIDNSKEIFILSLKIQL